MQYPEELSRRLFHISIRLSFNNISKYSKIVMLMAVNQKKVFKKFFKDTSYCCSSSFNLFSSSVSRIMAFMVSSVDKISSGSSSYSSSSEFWL